MTSRPPCRRVAYVRECVDGMSVDVQIGMVGRADILFIEGVDSGRSQLRSMLK